MSDDGFHEIQLNGKQLVFLFMAATVVSVVIFLCGVMVGRGVRGDRPDTASSAGDLPPAASTPAVSPSTSGPAAAAKGPTGAPPEPADDGSTMKDLSAENPSDGTLAPKSAPRPQVPAAKPAANGRAAPNAKAGAPAAAVEK